MPPENGTTMPEISGAQQRFAASRRAAGLVSWASPQSVALPLAYLRELGAAPVSPEFRSWWACGRALSGHRPLWGLGFRGL